MAMTATRAARTNATAPMIGSSRISTLDEIAADLDPVERPQHPEDTLTEGEDGDDDQSHRFATLPFSIIVIPPHSMKSRTSTRAPTYSITAPEKTFGPCSHGAYWHRRAQEGRSDLH